jgi:phage-related minor tail protein
MAGGNTGMMGENGPEAIVPLSRKNGRLGVDVTGAGGINITINVNVQGGGPGGPGGPGNSGGDAASATGARLIGEQVSSAVKQAVIDELRNQQRSGGILGPRVI